VLTFQTDIKYCIFWIITGGNYHSISYCLMSEVRLGVI
jgi:hypothetical protein